MASAERARASSARSARPAGRAPREVRGAVRPSGIRWDRVGRIMLLGLLGLVVLLYVHPLASMWSTRGEATRRSGDVVRLEREHAALQRRVRALRSQSALEREARRLGMVRAGERAYVISGLPSR